MIHGIGDAQLSVNRQYEEVFVNRVRNASLALALGVAVAASVVTGNAVSHRTTEPSHSGVVPEVLVVAETPRLVMDTVIVSAVRNVAALPAIQDLN